MLAREGPITQMQRGTKTTETCTQAMGLKAEEEFAWLWLRWTQHRPWEKDSTEQATDTWHQGQRWSQETAA